MSEGAVMDIEAGQVSEPALVQAVQEDDGIWRTSEGQPLNVSASDLERHAYCPLSWHLSRSGITGVGKAIEEGITRHAEIHRLMGQYEDARRVARRELTIWTWWFAIIIALGIDGAAFFIIDQTVSPNLLARYLGTLAITCMFMGLILTTLPWRIWFNMPPSTSPSHHGMEDWEVSIIEPVIQKPGFIGGWSQAGRTEAAFFFGAIITILHATALWGADDREQAGYILLMIALIWTLFASWRLQRVLLADNEAEAARHDAGLDQDTKVAYSDDSDSSDLLVDEETGLRGRPDQIVIIDGEFIPVEQKTGKIPTGPHASHRMQLLAYLQLVSRNTDRSPPYGILRYGEDTIFKVHWDDEARDDLKRGLVEIQRLMVDGGAERNHERVGKCKNCSRRRACPSSLA